MQVAEGILRETLRRSVQFIKEQVQKELEEQGHRATGKGIDDMDITIERTRDGFVAKLMVQDYLFIVDKGVTPGRVPFSGRGSGGGGSESKYIQALIDWIKVIKPSLEEAERKSFAFAIANKAKEEGHPTRGSFEFSRNGRRKEWSKFAIDQNIPRFEQLLDLGNFVAATIDNFVTEYQRITLG